MGNFAENLNLGNRVRLQKITKTEVVGLQKLKWLIFDCCRKTNHLRYI